MKALIDTNVVIDILTKRSDFCEISFGAISKMLDNDVSCYASASAVTDIYYIARKKFGRRETYQLMNNLTEMFEIAEVNEECIYRALLGDIADFEDGVIAAVAENINASLIVTRNTKDFANCAIRVMDPKEI